MRLVKDDIEMWLLERGFEEDDCGEFIKDSEGKEVNITFSDDSIYIDIDNVGIRLENISFEMMVQVLESIRIYRCKL